MSSRLDLDAAATIARNVLSPAQNGPTVAGSTCWWRGSAKELATALLELQRKHEATLKLLEGWTTRAGALVNEAIDHATWKRWRDLADAMAHCRADRKETVDDG